MTSPSVPVSEPDLVNPFPDDDDHARSAAFRDPSRAEVAGSASPAYVMYLSRLLDQRGPFDDKLLQRLDALARERDERATRLMHTQAHAEALRSLQQEVTEKTLQLQEERERSLRLQHENTVLHAQGATLEERVAALAGLCRARGLDGPAREPVRRPTRQPRSTTAAAHDTSVPSLTGSPVELPMPKSFSLRAARPTAASAQAPASSANTSGSTSPASPGSEHPDMALHRALTLSEGGETSAALRLALTEEVQMLREQLETQRSLYEHERGKRLVEYEQEHRQSVEQTRQLLNTIQHLEELHEVCLRDLVQYRHRSEKALRDSHGQVDWLKQHMQEALSLAERHTRRSAGAAVVSEQRALERVNPIVTALRHDHAKLKAELREAQQAHTVQVSTLDQELQNAKSAVSQERMRRRREEERHRLEMEGVRSELDLMRHALRQMEKRVYFTGSRQDLAATEEQKLTEDYYY